MPHLGRAQTGSVCFGVLCVLCVLWVLCLHVLTINPCVTAATRPRQPINLANRWRVARQQRPVVEDASGGGAAE